MKTKFLFITTLAVAALSISSIRLFAESSGSNVTETQGVNGDTDSDNRAPLVLLDTKITSVGVALLVDGYIPNKDYAAYPVRYEFFINRRLISTQYRSEKNSGAIGLDVTPSIASTPFNYSIVATTLAPSSQYTTIVEGTAQSNLTSSFSCTATYLGETYTSSESVSTTQSGTSGFTFSFVGTGTESASATFSGTVTTDSSATVTAEVSVTPSGETEPTSYSITGTSVTSETGSLSSFVLGSNDGDITIDCSQAA